MGTSRMTKLPFRIDQILWFLLVCYWIKLFVIIPVLGDISEL